jgi:hypothetical protein
LRFFLPKVGHLFAQVAHDEKVNLSGADALDEFVDFSVARAGGDVVEVVQQVFLFSLKERAAGGIDVVPDGIAGVEAVTIMEQRKGRMTAVPRAATLNTNILVLKRANTENNETNNATAQTAKTLA